MTEEEDSGVPHVGTSPRCSEREGEGTREQHDRESDPVGGGTGMKSGPQSGTHAHAGRARPAQDLEISPRAAPAATDPVEVLPP